MATAIAKLKASSSGNHLKSLKKSRVASFVQTESKKTRFLRLLKKTFLYTLFLLILISGVTLITSYYFYKQYEAIVEQRIDSGFWHSRAGIYSAPFVLRKGQKTNIDNFVELLRRAGYVEGDTTDEIWNGNYKVNGDIVQINNKNYAAGRTETAEITIKNNYIASINDGKTALDEFPIESELLTGRTETKRGKNHVLTYEEIPENLRNAILTAEDRRFFEHHGIDPQGILRAIFANYQKGTIRQGGSTITQQLVKNTFLTSERSFSRKFSEAFLSLALERKMSKEEIFTLYCNEIYLGQYGLTGIHGVEQAARAYFDKDLKELNLQESAAIAAMIKNPNRFAPHKNIQQAAERRNWIIDKMSELKLIPSETAKIAQNTELKLAKPKINDRAVAPYFVDAATKEINEKFSTDYLNTNFNNRIYTTIDTQLQYLAEQSVAGQLAALDKIYAKKGKRLQATIVAIDPQNGHVLAMVGGRDYRESQFNRATDAMRQPGSTFKPFVYATALERGFSPANTANDSPTEFQIYGQKNYQPANYGNSYAMKNISLKTALAKSSNVIAVKTAMDVGLTNVARKAQQFGFEKIQPYPSMPLGTNEVTPIQLAAAYCVFANGGKRIIPTLIDRIVSVEDETIYLSTPTNDQVINPRTAYMITDMLEAVVERGTARRAFGALGKDVVFAGKTGSSKDGWFVGYTPNLVTVAWVGLDDSEDINATGGEVALPLWIDFMKSVMQARPEFGGGIFPMPNGLEEVTIDPETGMMADIYCPQREKVVVQRGMISSLKCFKHQPLPETLSASLEESQPDNVKQEEEIAAAVFENEEKTDFAQDVEKISDSQSIKKNQYLNKTKINRTLIEDFENLKAQSETQK